MGEERIIVANHLGPSSWTYLALGLNVLHLCGGALANALAAPQLLTDARVRVDHGHDGQYVGEQQYDDVVADHPVSHSVYPIHDHGRKEEKEENECTRTRAQLGVHPINIGFECSSSSCAWNSWIRSPGPRSLSLSCLFFLHLPTSCVHWNSRTTTPTNGMLIESKASKRRSDEVNNFIVCKQVPCRRFVRRRYHSICLLTYPPFSHYSIHREKSNIQICQLSRTHSLTHSLA